MNESLCLGERVFNLELERYDSTPGSTACKLCDPRKII